MSKKEALRADKRKHEILKTKASVPKSHSRYGLRQLETDVRVSRCKRHILQRKAPATTSQCIRYCFHALYSPSRYFGNAIARVHI